jgi:hypothetical protein
VRGAGVELGRLTPPEREVLRAQSQPQLAAQHVEPLEAVVDAELGELSDRRIRDLVSADRRVLQRKRCDHEPSASNRRPAYAGIGRVLAHEIIDADPELPRHRHEKGQTRLALA